MKRVYKLNIIYIRSILKLTHEQPTYFRMFYRTRCLDTLLKTKHVFRPTWKGTKDSKCFLFIRFLSFFQFLDDCMYLDVRDISQYTQLPRRKSTFGLTKPKK